MILSRNFEKRGCTLNSDHDSFFLKFKKTFTGCRLSIISTDVFVVDYMTLIYGNMKEKVKISE